jgi:hypothetical protein
MLTCPHCHHEIRIRELPHPEWFKNYRICTTCTGRFTVDGDTKIRQALFLVIAFISLFLTLYLYFDGNAWLTPAIVSYVFLALIIYWGNKRVYFVPYKTSRNTLDDE